MVIWKLQTCCIHVLLNFVGRVPKVLNWDKAGVLGGWDVAVKRGVSGKAVWGEL